MADSVSAGAAVAVDALMVPICRSKVGVAMRRSVTDMEKTLLVQVADQAREQYV